MKTSFPNCPKQRGVAAIEFALIAPVFFMLLIGVMEFGRMLFYMNAAAEATRFGARIAVVCDLDAAGIQDRMISRLSILDPGNIDVSYNPDGCSAATCQSVTVSLGINGAAPVTVDTMIPFIEPALSLLMPSFSTTLPRESLRTTIGGENNELCT